MISSTCNLDEPHVMIYRPAAAFVLHPHERAVSADVAAIEVLQASLLSYSYFFSFFISLLFITFATSSAHFTPLLHHPPRPGRQQGSTNTLPAHGTCQSSRLAKDQHPRPSYDHFQSTSQLGIASGRS
jgi:hypothetical protein